MNTTEILTILQRDIHSTIMATIDEKGNPTTSAIDMMLLENDHLYFLTARGKSIYSNIMNHPVIALTGMKGEDTLSTVAISLQGKARNIGHQKLDKIFEVNPYMTKIYPNLESRDALEVFEIESCHGEYFDLSKLPIERASFSVNEQLHEIRYRITDRCIGCGKCAIICPQHCIQHYQIDASHCLHCGKCAEICPVKAIVKE